MAAVFLKMVLAVLSTTIFTFSMNSRIKQTLTQIAIESGGYVDCRRVPMAAGVVYKKNLITTGVNQMKTHPMMMGEGYREDQLYMHAEVDAIRNALRVIDREQLKQCDMYIVRVKRPYIKSKTWVHGLAKPCPGCQQVIDNFGLKNVYWTDDEDLTLSHNGSIILS